MAKKKADRAFAPSGTAKGCLIIIGGHEERRGECKILKRVVERSKKGKIVVATVASRTAADDLWEEYLSAFRTLGMKKVEHLRMNRRQDAFDPSHLDLLKDADAVFFTGGDQLKITSEIGGTELHDAICRMYQQGKVIAGTSAGASVICETMLVSGRSDETYRPGGSLRMAPGLGLLQHVIVDQHFAERGRIGRLLGAVAQNPKSLGIGIDENTAIIVDRSRQFEVVGSGGVYVIDAHGSIASNITEAGDEEALSLFGIHMHLLSDADRFDFRTRQPEQGSRN